MVRFERKKKPRFTSASVARCACLISCLCFFFYIVVLRRFFSASSNKQEEVTFTADFVGFVRIPKTGSTSVWWFMQDYSRLENFRKYFEGWINPEQLSLVSCMFGPPTREDPTDDDEDSGECRHLEYNRTRFVWHKAIDMWMSREFANTNVDTIRVTMETFTMVRNPFDRLCSYFYYVYERVEDRTWAGDNTKAQYERVLEGDFFGWMELVLSEGIPHGPQYGYIDDNVDTAIELVTGDSPNVTVLVNECFEASLRLLAEKVSLQEDAVDTFVKSEDFVLNVSEKRKYNTTELAALNVLRERSKRELSNEYKFYNAAVQQFRRQLSLLGDARLRNDCDLYTSKLRSGSKQ